MFRVSATLGDNLQYINDYEAHIKGSIAQEAGAISKFTFDIYPDNVGYDLIQSRKTIVRAVNLNTGREEFSGRVLLARESMDAKGTIKKSVTCESFLGYLHDSVQPYKPEMLYTLEEFLDLVLSNHNAKVEPEKHIYRGKVDVEVADTGYVYKGLQYQTTYDTIKTKLVDVFGGELEIEEIDGVLYLNYLQQIGETRATSIKLGHNMQQASREISPLNVITRVIPLGAKLVQKVTNTDGSTAEQETSERLTLEGYVLTDGTPMAHPWIDDEEKQATLGIICGTLDFPDVTEQSNLYRKAMEYMAKENLVDLAHTLTAYDLKEIGLDIDSLNCCDSYPVINESIGLNEVLRINKKTIDITAPWKSSLTIGQKKTALSNIQASEVEKLGTQIQQIAGTMQSVSNKAEVATSYTEHFMTSLEQTVTSIVSAAIATFVTESELKKITEELSTAITQTAEGVKTEFSKTVETIEKDVNGWLESTLREYGAYINCYMNVAGKPVIELGSSESGVYARITNERFSILENGVELFYVYQDQLQVTDLTVLRRLLIADYAIDPAETGTVSIFKVGR